MRHLTNSYFKALENCYRIQIDSNLRNTIINHFEEDKYCYTEQDICEQTRKLIQEYSYRNKKIIH